MYVHANKMKNKLKLTIKLLIQIFFSEQNWWFGGLMSRTRYIRK